MSKQVLQERATALKALHVPGNPVILPTVWDAWSAKLAVDAGFAALTVGSHPVADSVGKEDGEGMSFDDLTDARRADHRRGRRADLGRHRVGLRRSRRSGSSRDCWRRARSA